MITVTAFDPSSVPYERRRAPTTLLGTSLAMGFRPVPQPDERQAPSEVVRARLG